MADLPDSLEYRLSDEGLVFAADTKSLKTFAVSGDSLVEILDDHTSYKILYRMSRLSKPEALALLKASRQLGKDRGNIRFTET